MTFPIRHMGVYYIAVAFAVILITCCFVFKDGTLWSMGRNKYGYLGRNGTDDCPNLAPIAGLPAIEEIYVGWYHCVARTRDNEVCIVIVAQ